MSRFAHSLWCPALMLGVVGSLALAPVPGLSQSEGAIEGRVVIRGSEEGVPGVRLLLDGQGLQAFSDATGHFRLGGVPAGGHELRADLVGCSGVKLVVDVSPRVSASVLLLLDGPAVSRSGATVDAGTGVATPENLLPFTVERLDRADIQHDPGRSIADLIRGAFPGVKVVQGSGLPGDGLSIQLRGPSSISGRQDPLVVLDGVITSGGPEDLDPFDVERIEVLKGSAAAAMYGARGHAGVIEITTRRPTFDDGARCFLRSVPSS